VAHIYELSNTLQAALTAARQDGAITPAYAAATREAIEIMVQLFSPMMPHLAEECWTVLGHKTLIAEAPWPKVEAALLVEDTITLPVQVNGKKRAEATVPRNASNSEIEAAVLLLEGVQRALEGKAPKKVIVVPQRIVNVVA
jgi:leucyl-tRNA synthetase